MRYKPMHSQKWKVLNWLDHVEYNLCWQGVPDRIRPQHHCVRDKDGAWQLTTWTGLASTVDQERALNRLVFVDAAVGHGLARRAIGMAHTMSEYGFQALMHRERKRIFGRIGVH